MNKVLIVKYIAKNEGEFPSQLKQTDIVPIMKRNVRAIKVITDQ